MFDLRFRVFILYLMTLFFHYIISLGIYFDSLDKQINFLYHNISVLSDFNYFLVEDINSCFQRCHNVLPVDSILFTNGLCILSLIISCFISFNILLADSFSISTQVIPDYFPFQSQSDFDVNLNIAKEIFKHFFITDFSTEMFDRGWRLNHWAWLLTKQWVNSSSSLEELSDIQKILAHLDFAIKITKELHIRGQILDNLIRYPQYNSISGKDLSEFIRCMEHYESITNLLEQLRAKNFHFQK